MALALHEMHPAIVHVPVALLPVAIGADLIGRASDNPSLLSFGQKAICIAAVGAVAAVASGLIAGEEVNVEGKSRDMLMTHRNLNVAAATIASCLALWRLAQERPNDAYLAIGAAGVGVVGYTAYLGGELVYDHGAGVAPARGVYRPDAPQLREGQLAAFFRDAATDLGHGVKHMLQEVAQGYIIPTVVAAFRKPPSAPPRQRAQTTA